VHLVEDSSKMQLADVLEPHGSFTSTMRGQGVAILLDSAPRTWGSREEMHLRLSQALIARGLRPVLVFSEEIPEDLRNRYLTNGIDVAPAVNYEKGVYNYYRKLRGVIRTYNVTAVHIAFFNYFSLIPWLARLSGVRYAIYHERNSGVLRAKACKKQLLRLRTRLATLPITRVAAISSYIGSQLVDVGIPERKIFLVYNGVDSVRFSPDPSARLRWAEQFGVRSDEMILTSMAALLPFKHPEITLEAYGLLAKRGVNARLFMAGVGPMREQLQKLSSSLGVSNKVHWLGDYDKPEDLLQASDIFVLTSVGEAFGNVLAEALACGVPVVASRSGSIPEIVQDRKTGLLATPLDPASFADAIELLSRNDQLRREMGLRAVERVRDWFTVDASVEQMLKVYESMWAERYAA
jgi:glycosyltransferase involved in cell wall biosynthesis